MSLLHEAYKRLLADIGSLSDVSLDAPDVMTDEWVLIEAPKLDKEILYWLENGGEIPAVPEWLLPLWNRFLLKREAFILGLIRDALVFCYKAEYEPTQNQLLDAQASFVETDEAISYWDGAFERKQLSWVLLSYMRRYVGRVIARANFAEILPSHGPGAVFPSRKAYDKSKFQTIYSGIQRYYPFDQFFCGLPSFWWETMVEEAGGSISLSDSIIAKLVAVPKDSRGPRLICVHPAESIWIQQGQRRVLESAIERSPLTRGRINFRDQSVNAQIALHSSKTREFCTLDLKDASDRISLKLVKYLFGYSSEYLCASRADSVLLMDGRSLTLRKFAPMGNAITFPVESLVFFCAVRAGILCHHGVTCDDVYVFGDDIAFPSCYYDGAILGLTSIGCVTNVSKTFRKGLFRESCGMDAFNGVCVTPHRMRVRDIASVPNAVSVCALAKALRIDGYEHTSSYLYSAIRKQFGYLPLGNSPSAQGLYEVVDYDLGKLMRYEKIRYNRHLHIYESPIRLVRDYLEVAPVHGWYHVQDSLLSLERSSEVYFRGEHDDGYPVPHRERLTCGWTRVD